jgi:glucuronosyltransferase
MFQDLEDFAASSGKDGFIFFSMGSILKGSRMPETHRLALLKAFSRIKQKVLWKWETESMPDLPPNVKLVKWAPQQDILGHPKIRAFITHGGLGSTTETVYHGVPFIGIPMYGDQQTNVEKFMRMGLATYLDFNTLDEDSVVTAIETVVNDPT